MPLQPRTTEFLRYLAQNKAVRDKICAPPHQTMLYSGQFTKAAWQELDDLRKDSKIGTFVTLPDALRKIAGPGSFATLADHVDDIEKKVSWKPDGFVMWRALSGIFASNAVGHVFFYIGSGVDRENKVFAATEVHVIARNAKIDPVMKAAIVHLVSCVRSRQADIGFGYLPIRGRN